ncbi:hypothetical protein B0H21DRAFT_549934 [Amylocystis lapponica]|nr:hypothetical protein B0H21DRAFT_549934 [Amylocystis lapponica]
MFERTPHRAAGSPGSADVLDVLLQCACDCGEHGRRSCWLRGAGHILRGSLVRVALFNYRTEPSDANDYTVTISIPGAMPAQVQDKYPVAPSVEEKFDITWGGQTFGPVFSSDGRLQGTDGVVGPGRGHVHRDSACTGLHTCPLRQHGA